MILEWPQLTYLALTLFSIGFVLAKDGETRKYSFIDSFLGSAIGFFLLWKGGFFG